MARKPLEHIKVLDFTHILAGPYCTMILANLGAEIIKLEKPDTGDDSRAFGPFINGQSAYFISINKGKKSIAVDLKSGKGIELVKELVREVDVVTENFRPGTMETLGLGYEDLKSVNPGIIYAAVSGFGQTGPYSQRPAYDMIVQGMSGLMSITGIPGGEPVRVGTSIGDITAGMFGAIGILAVLIDREITGEGRMVDVAMLDGQLAILENAISRYIATGQVPRPLGSEHPSIAPFAAYKTADGYIILACGNNPLWEKFLHIVGRTDLLEKQEFRTNALRAQHAGMLKGHMEEIFTQKTTAEWNRLLNEKGIPCSPINTIDRLFGDPHVAARRMLIEVEQPGTGKMKVVGNPIKISDMEQEIPVGPAPAIGQHTDQVLKAYLGYTEKEISKLKEANVIK